MKIYFSPIFLLLFAFITSTTAQELSGTVVDQNKEPIYYATAALYNASDSTIAKVESTDEKGFFKLKNIEDGSYYLVVSLLSYQDLKVNDIKFPNSNQSNLNLTLLSDSEILETVEVVGKTPLLEQQADKLVVNVADNVTNTSGSLLDVMKKVPGMIVINDRLSLAGGGNPTIYLNGKSTQYMDVQSLLKDMPGDNIQKVEIIHQPGAEYEAAGSGPIINIVLKKNALFGTNGSFRVGVGKGQLWDYNTGVSLSHYEGKFNIMAGAGFSRNAYVEELILTRRLTNIDDALDGTYFQKGVDEATPYSYRGNVRVDYDITNQHRIGIEAKHYNSDREYTAYNDTKVDLLRSDLPDYELTTTNDIDNGWNYTSINPYYIFEIDTAGQKIDFDVNLAFFNRKGLNTLSTTSNFDENPQKQRYNQIGANQIFASAVDYIKPFSSQVKLKLGVKYSNADLDNDLQSRYFFNQDWINDDTQSNHYLFREKIYAAYSKVDWTAGKWSGTTGLRYERSDSEGESLTIDSTLNRTISKFFPSFSLSRNITKQLKSTIAYSYRIDRPRYSSLNPFVYYLDPFTYQKGNQNLRPELTHSAKFTLSFENQPFFNVEYKHSNDAIVEVTNQEKDTQEAFKTDVNFDEQTQLSFSLFFPLSFIKGLDGYGGVIVTKNTYNSDYDDAIFNRSKWQPVAFIQAEFKLPWDINAEVGGWFAGPQQEGIFDAEYLYGTSAGLSKKFMDGKAKLSIGVEDFANRFWHANVNYQQDMDIVSTWQAPVVNARFSYKFGNQHLKSGAKRSGSASEEMRRANQGN